MDKMMKEFDAMKVMSDIFNSSFVKSWVIEHNPFVTDTIDCTITASDGNKFIFFMTYSGEIWGWNKLG